ncbi:MAG: hypothetical protein QGG40_01800 [Myxococcota bacterium]|jgi:hypothetical protein|nr:hypothetical protein [Myxococcota bacterium]
MSGLFERACFGVGLLLCVSCVKQAAVEAPAPRPDWVVNSAAVVLEDGTGTATGSAVLTGTQQDAEAIAQSKARFELTRLLGCGSLGTTTLGTFTDREAEPDTLWIQVVGTCQQVAPPPPPPTPTTAAEAESADGDGSEPVTTGNDTVMNPEAETPDPGQAVVPGEEEASQGD